MFFLCSQTAFAADEVVSDTKSVVAEVDGVEYDDFSTALKAVKENSVVDILSDITITEKWDARNTGANISVPVTINGNGHTLKLTNVVNDGYNYLSVFRFENTATVKNLTIDMSEAISEFNGRFRAIACKLDLVVDNCTFIGSTTYTNTRAIIFGEGAQDALKEVEISVTNSHFENWRRGVSDNENGQDAKSLSITGCEFVNAGVAVSAAESVTFTGNTVIGADAIIKSYTVGTALSVVATNNTLDVGMKNAINAAAVIAQPEFDFSAVAKVGDTAYATLADAIADNKDIADPVTIYITGNATWETGAAHGSTPFGMATNALTIEGVEGTDATFTAIGAGVGPVGQESGNVTFKNLTIKDESVSYAENSWEFGYLEFRGALAFENCTFVNAVMFEGDNLNATFTNCMFNSNKESEYDVWVSDGTVTFTGCTFEGYRGLKVHEAYGTEVTSVTVDDCTFGPLSKKPGIAIGTLNADTAIIVKNSTFIDCQAGDQGKYIYETDTDVTTFTFTLENNDVTCSQHTLTKTDAVAPKCEEIGNITYWTCGVCTKIFSDEAATIQITAADTVVAETGHTEKLVTKCDPTCVEKGYTGDMICNVCHKTLTQGSVIEATGVHTYLDGVCTMCKTADPNYKPAEKVEMGTTDTMEDTLNDEAANITEAIGEDGKLSDDIKVDEETKAKIEETIAEAKENKANGGDEIVIVVEQVAIPVEESSVSEETTNAMKEGLETVKNEIAENATENIEDQGIVQYLDLSVLVKAHNVDEDTKVTLGEIEETKNEIVFTITVPEQYLQPGYEVFVLRYHGDEVEKLPLEHVEENIYSFKTNKFSNYALAYVSTHVHTETLINAVDADCGNNGYTGDKVCSTCGVELEKGSVIYASGAHNWSEWKQEKGIAHTFRECWTCGNSEYLDATAETTGSSAGSTATGTAAPATGDMSNVFVWIMLMVVSCGMVLGTVVYRKQR